MNMSAPVVECQILCVICVSSVISVWNCPFLCFVRFVYDSLFSSISRSFTRILSVWNVCSMFVVFFGSLLLQFEMVVWIKEWGWLKWKSNKISVHFYFRFHSIHPPTVLPPSPLCIATKEMMIWMSTSFLVDTIFLMVCSLNWNYYSFCCVCSLVFFTLPILRW